MIDSIIFDFVYFKRSRNLTFGDSHSKMGDEVFVGPESISIRIWEGAKIGAGLVVLKELLLGTLPDWWVIKSN